MSVAAADIASGSISPVLSTVTVLLLAGGGLLSGSLLTVLIHRVPDGRSVMRPGPSCPSCGAPIGARDGIPVVSWLILRGRCRACRARIPVRYPLVEISTMLVWLVLGWWALFLTAQPGLLPLLLVLGNAGVALFVIDVRHHRLPNVIVLPLYPITVVGLVIAGLTSGRWPLTATGVGAAMWLVIVGLPWLISGGRGMGFGDVKISPVLGATLAWTSFSAAVWGIVLAFVAGALVGLALLITGRASRSSALAFGPYLLGGAMAGLLLGPWLSGALPA